uniref:Uncharacterized protein n=1 Tax=Physcomitrium patens TaxID=3218 RepID=A0A2K1KN65_PHYPA|nr:hypothetical protein PHYPA_006119 [Physcomitrium patens]
MITSFVMLVHSCSSLKPYPNTDRRLLGIHHHARSCSYQPGNVHLIITVVPTSPIRKTRKLILNHRLLQRRQHDETLVNRSAFRSKTLPTSTQTPT